jgi:integrase
MSRRRSFGSIRRLPSGRYQARYEDAVGVEHRGPTTFSTKADANRWLSTIQADMARGEWSDPRLGRVTLGRWADEWLATTVHLKAKTRVGYESVLRTHVRPAFGSTPIAAIDQMQVRRFIAELTRKGAAAGTVRNAYRVLNLILVSAVGAGAIKINPAAGVRLPRSERGEMVFLTPGQVHDLAAELGEANGLLVTFAAYTGLRAAEIAGLRVGRVDLGRRVVDVVETIGEANGRLVSGPTKTHERRTVPLPRFLAKDLESQLEPRSSDPDALVFTAPEGGPVRHNNFYRRHFRPAVRRAGLPSATRFHDLRHTCAAMLIANGAHPKAIAELLGHSTITVTLDRYGHLFPGLAEKLADGLDRTHGEAEKSPAEESRRRE